MLLKKYSNYSTFFLCFIIGFFYCTSLTLASFLFQNIATILLIFFLIFLIVKNTKSDDINPPNFKNFILQFLFIIAGISFSAQVFKTPTIFFWAQDSLLTHIPESLKFTDFFKGNFNIWPTLGHVDGRTTHALTGLSIAIFGLNSFSTIIVQTILKIFTAIIICKICELQWNKKIGITSAAIYCFCPTIFFYSLTLYKEGLVQLTVAAIIYCLLKVFIKKQYIYIVPLALSHLVLLGERSYLSFIFTIPILILPIFCLDIFKTNVKKIIYIIFLCLAVVCVVKFNLIDFNQKFNRLKELREHYSSFSDVQNKFNYEIPLPVAFVKILLSPYFTMNKFDIFRDTSLLLIWGSLINQIIIVVSLFGLAKAGRKNIYHLVIWFPFIIFLLFAAYISPWSGRLRDSFYPLIACYAAYYLYNNKYFIKIFRIKDEQTEQP